MRSNSAPIDDDAVRDDVQNVNGILDEVGSVQNENGITDEVGSVQNVNPTHHASESGKSSSGWALFTSLVDARGGRLAVPSDIVANGTGPSEACGVLVHDDNERFLRSYLQVLQGQVRLLYLDPPYNTGYKLRSYNDKFERAEWLAMMRLRLQLVLPMLAENGSICASIDDSEMPYLRILMDEVVGEKYFVACIAYERSGSAGLGQSGAILNTKEYVLIYSFDKRQLNDVGNTRPIDKEVMRRYNKVLVDEGERDLVAEITGKTGIARLYKHSGICIHNISIRKFDLRRDEIESVYKESFERIFRTQNVQKENTFQNDVIARLQKDEFYSLDYVPARGRYKGEQKTLYYWNGELCAWLKDSSALTPDGIVKRNKLTDFWSHGEIPKADLANEGGVEFSRSKKPEHLLFRLVSLCTEPGDLVLDLFSGSATAPAVSHKMKRRWIGVESGEHFRTCTLRRMQNVLDGDQSGVSKLLQWRGGGSFRYLD
ncbi:site-specific DNA-methyltransferase [Candidatus Obscuribacterales bacterium]|nr:site-specific DNA-methyltransferase [Candidatus Obscuribacterales bacterium]